MEEKIFYQPGDIVILRQDIPNKPTMYVVKKKTTHIKNSESDSLIGIICRWFTSNGVLQEEVFNTKDLIKIK